MLFSFFSQSGAKEGRLTAARHEPVKAEFKKMEQEILLHINQVHKETVRMICWDYAGQVGIAGIAQLALYLSHSHLARVVPARWELSRAFLLHV